MKTASEMIGAAELTAEARTAFKQALWADTVKIQLQNRSNLENAFGQALLVLKQFDTVFPVV